MSAIAHDGLVVMTTEAGEVVRVVLREHPERTPTLAEVERAYIERVLRACEGNKTRAAAALDIDRKTLHRKLAWYAVLDDRHAG